MTYKELKEYVKNKNKKHWDKWQKEIAVHGPCSPLTIKEYLKHKDIIIAGKRNYKIKFVHNKLWKI